MTALQKINLGLRVSLETGIVCAMSYWGYSIANGTAWKIVLAMVAPVLVYGFWGTVDFHQARRMSEPLRLTQELVISGLAAVAVYAAGAHAFAWALAFVSIAHHALVYTLGTRLLNATPPNTTADARELSGVS